VPRGAKRDLAVTKLLKNEGFFEDPRSFTGLDGHLYLKGIDKVNQRTRIFQRFENKCCVCGAMGAEFGEPGFRMEWHHIARCDCLACSEIRCGQLVRDCHRHRTDRFNRKASKMKRSEDERRTE
jgi:hypothetical protein